MKLHDLSEQYDRRELVIFLDVREQFLCKTPPMRPPWSGLLIRIPARTAGTPGPRIRRGSPLLPPTSYASVPGGDVPLFKLGSTTTYATDVKDVLSSSTTNILWELDGYSAYSAGSLDTSGTGSVPKVWTQVDYSASGTQFNGYTQGPGYYGKTFFLWPPDPRNGSITNSTTLKTYLSRSRHHQYDRPEHARQQLDHVAGPGTTTGLTNLQNWLTGATTSGGPYTTTSKFVADSSSKAPIYYAVCRLFNRAYPAGASNGAFSADWRSRFFGTTSNTALFN